jgi:hypothetical protein
MSKRVPRTIAYQFPASAVLVHAPDRNGRFAPELAASVVLHFRFAIFDGHHLALAASLTGVQVFPDLAGPYLDPILRDVFRGRVHARFLSRSDVLAVRARPYGLRTFQVLLRIIALADWADWTCPEFGAALNQNFLIAA